MARPSKRIVSSLLFILESPNTRIKHPQEKLPCVEYLCNAGDSIAIPPGTDEETKERKKESLGGQRKKTRRRNPALWNAAFLRRREQIAYKTRRVHALRIRSEWRSRHANEKGRTNEQKSSILVRGREGESALYIALIGRVFPNNAHANSRDSHHPSPRKPQEGELKKPGEE